MTLLDQFNEHAQRHPERIAVHDKGRNCTYGELTGMSNRIAARLQAMGVAPGDRVAIVLPNCVEYVASYLAIQRIGGIVVALNPQSTRDELAGVLQDAEPVAAVVSAKGAGLLGDAISLVADRPLRFVVVVGEVKTQPGDAQVVWESWADALAHGSGEACRPCRHELAQIIYTSGTTGPPKGVVLSHRNILVNCDSIVGYLGLTAGDSVLAILPFFYSYGNSLLFTHLAVGGRLVIGPEFVFWNSVLDCLEQQEVTGFSGVPATYALLLHKSDLRRRSFPALRYLTCAGGALPLAHVAAVREAIPHAKLFLMYGQTEGTARLSTLLPDELDEKAGSIGRGIQGVTLSVVSESGEPVAPGEIGEVVARGANVMQGYWNDPETTAKVLRPDGLHTGDLGRVDEEGYIYLVGRNNDLIKSGAYRIHPQEIEDVLAELPGVAEAAVVGMPDEIWGERPVAYVVASSAAGEGLEQRAWEHCRGRLPRHKQPREVHTIDRLPRTSSGKVKRAALRAMNGSGTGLVATGLATSTSTV